VLVVDDDDLFRESLARNLSDAGFEVRDFCSGPDALSHLADGLGADLAILDWRMPVMSGIELLKRIRADGRDLPVIFLTALTDQIYEEAALATGAVDFVEKSRSFGIVLKRVQLILDGAKNQASSPAAASLPSAGTGEIDADTLQAGDLALKLKTGRAQWRGSAVDLTLTEFKMVLHLVRNSGEELTYRALYDVVHGSGFFAGTGSDGYRANVRTFIKRIRRKFRDLDDTFDEIENYAGFGYRWKTTP
jgi:two-component system response regulator ChvI